MKKITLDLYERIIDKIYDVSLLHKNLLGDVSKDLCAEYIGFYAHHGGLFWSEENGEICGVGTVHPGKRDFNWKWSDECGEWTSHIVWSINNKSTANLLRCFLKQQTRPVRVWACRRGGIVELSQKKLERIFSYGRRRNNSNAAASGSELQRVNALDPAIADRSCSSGVCP